MRRDRHDRVRPGRPAAHPHGGVWEPEEEDPTENRECTAPGWLAPYEGKYEVPNTTPDALQCQQLMAGMLDNGATATAMEVSSHALAQGRVDCVDFDVAVFTNLTSDHLDFHGTVEAYREAKAELFRGLTDPERQRAVINLDPSDDLVNDAKNDEKNGEAFSESDFFIAAAGGGDRVPVITYATHASLSDRADVFVEKAELSLFETIVSIRTPAGSFDAACGLVGEVNVTNIAAAVAVGTALEIPLDVIAAGVEAMEPVPGRMELVDEGQPFPVIVDYAHTPDALRRAVKSIRRTGAANVIVVFGCGGDRDASKRAEMGAVADALCDIVFVTNDNPRTEDPYAILDDITSGFRDACTTWSPSRTRRCSVPEGHVPDPPQRSARDDEAAERVPPVRDGRPVVRDPGRHRDGHRGRRRAHRGQGARGLRRGGEQKALVRRPSRGARRAAQDRHRAGVGRGHHQPALGARGRRAGERERAGRLGGSMGCERARVESTASALETRLENTLENTRLFPRTVRQSVS